MPWIVKIEFLIECGLEPTYRELALPFLVGALEGLGVGFSYKLVLA